MRRILHEPQKITSRMMLEAFEDGRPGIRRAHTSSNLSTRSRRLRTMALLAVTGLLVAFIPARWGLRLAIGVALLVLVASWLVFSVVGFAWDFYWPEKKHSPR